MSDKEVLRNIISKYDEEISRLKEFNKELKSNYIAMLIIVMDYNRTLFMKNYLVLGGKEE